MNNTKVYTIRLANYSQHTYCAQLNAHKMLRKFTKFKQYNFTLVTALTIKNQ